MDSEEQPKALERRELLVVFSVLALVHAVLFALGVPLPHQDLLFYLEPAFHLVRDGKLVAPAAEYIDLTYTVSFGFYPPGYFLILAPWLALFGAGHGSLLAFIHSVHLAYLIVLWVLLRTRFSVSKPIAALALVSAFPFWSFGRPDLLGVFFSACAWLLVPASGYGRRFVLATVVTGFSLLVSPSFGLGCLATNVAFIALAGGHLAVPSLRRGAVFGALAVGVMLTLWALVITEQGAWSTVPTQFRLTAMVRGTELNHFPTFSGPVLVFSLLPLVLATVLPAVAVLGRGQKLREHPVWIAAASYLAAFAAVFLTNKLQLLLVHHFGMVQRPVLHATLAGTKRPWRFVGLAATALFTLIHFYIQKEDLFYAVSGDLRYERIDPALVARARVVAVDSMYAPFVYGRLDKPVLDYHMVKLDYWRRFRNVSPKRLLAVLPENLKDGPHVPDLLLISSRAIMLSGPPNPDFFEQISGPALERVTFFGHELQVAKHPLALHVYRRRDGAPVPEHL
ncbi:MAG TPA: hypothetical protein VF103_02235 [Polyangiaceae bacterium]